MAVRHVITIVAAPGRSADFAAAFGVLQSGVLNEAGCEQYELFQSVDDPDKLIILERWTNQELLAKHQDAERSQPAPIMEEIMRLWAPGTTPTIERFETETSG